MVKSERINFKASKLAPNPLEFSYWIDLSTDYNGKVIRVFNPNTELWERMSTGGNGGGVSADVLDSINREIERLLLGKQNLLTAGEGININNDIISVTIDTDEFITRTEAKNLYLPKGNYTTEHYVDTKVASLVDTAPEALNTLNELAAALGDDPNFATTVSNEIGKKLDKSTYNTDKATFALKTEVPTDYYTKSAVDNRLANKADTSNVYSKTEVNNLLNTKQNKLVSGTTIKTINGVSLLGNGDIIVEGGSGSVDLSNYYTKDQTYDRSTIDSKIAAGGTFDSTNYYTKSQVDAAIENVEVDLTGYATEAWVTSKGYLTQHQDISGKANVSDVYTKSQTDSEIDTKVSALVNQAPETLNTLNELATALGNDPNFATTVSNLIGTKLNKTGGVMQGNLDFDETYKLSGIVNPTEEDDATNKRYVDTAIQNSLSNVEVNVPMATETTAGVIKIWKGTLVEYDAITTKDPDCIYLITES